MCALLDVVEDRELHEEKSSTSGPRIRCPLCGWSPRKEDKWFCTCGFEWNTFETGGVCPACLHQWTETKCLSSRIWCDSSEDSLINPVGRWHGVEQIMRFYRHDMGEMYSVRDLEISEVPVQVYSGAAWAEFNWNFSAKRRKEGSSVSFRGMETQIYRKNHDSWCLVHVHYSRLPAEEKAGTE